MRLHGDVGVEMIQCAISLLAAIPSTLIHALNLLITTSRTFVLLCAGNWDERINLPQRVPLEISDSHKSVKWIRDAEYGG